MIDIKLFKNKIKWRCDLHTYGIWKIGVIRDVIDHLRIWHLTNKHPTAKIKTTVRRWVA